MCTENLTCFTYFLVFCLHAQYAFLVLNFLSLFLWLGAHNIQNDINFLDFSLILSRIPNFPPNAKFTNFSLTLKFRFSRTFHWPWQPCLCLPPAVISVKYCVLSGFFPEKWTNTENKDYQHNTISSYLFADVSRLKYTFNVFELTLAHTY